MLKHYLTTALRNFRRHWVTTAVNVVGLALGLACFIGALSAAKYYELDDNHYPGSDRTYVIATEYDTMGGSGLQLKFFSTPWILAEHLKSQAQSDGIARATYARNTSVTVAGIAKELRSSYADAEFLKLFPLTFIFGDFKTALTRPGTAVISQAAAVRLFGRSDVIGQNLFLDGEDFVTIVGVTAAPQQPSHIGDSETLSTLRFEMLVSMDMLRTSMQRSIPAEEVEQSLQDWNGNANTPAPLTYIRLIARDTANLNALQGALAKLSELHPSTAHRRFSAYPLKEIRAEMLTIRVEGTGLSWASFLMTVAAAVLLVSCLNYINLSAALLLAHRKEIGIRRVIGANARQLAMQSLVDSILLTLAAAFLAILLLLTARPLIREIFDLDMVYTWTHSRDVWMPVLATIIGVCVVVTIYPALLIRHSTMAAALRQERGIGSKNSAARALVALQFILASTMLIGIFIVRAQHASMRQTALDSLPDPIVVIDNDLRAIGLSFETLRAELIKKPAIAAVSGSFYGGPWRQNYGLIPVSRSLAPETGEFPVMVMNIHKDYFSTMHIASLAGKLLDEDGDPSSIEIRTVIDRATARRLGWNNPNDAVGKQFYPGPSSEAARKRGMSYHVLGVVEDKPSQFSDRGAVGTFYKRSAGQLTPQLTPIIRLSKSQLTEGLASIDTAWRELSPNHVLRRTFLDERIERYMTQLNFDVKVVSWVTALAITIALSGLIGMSVHMAHRRRHEVGVRKTLGARTSQVTALLLRDLLKPVIVGNALAWPLAYVVTQAYSNQYSHRIGFSPLPFLLGLAATAAIAAAAVAWQAVRAASANPARMLRHE